MSWLDDLEAELEKRLASFLRDHPVQEDLMAEQQRSERLEQLRRQRLQLQEQADQERQRLLQLAVEIRRWQERVERARRAGAHDLADRARAHVDALMERGRRHWQRLSELGQRHSAVEWELSQCQSRPAAGAGDLQSDWAAFEAEQDLEALKRNLGR